MKKIFLFLFLLQLIIPAQDVNIDGMWQGTLDVGSVKLRLVFHFKTDDKGVITTIIDSPDQGANGIPTTKTTFTDGKLSIVLKELGAEYNATYYPKDGSFFGNWSQGGADFSLLIARNDKVEEVKRPQTPKPPFPYKSEDVTFENVDAGITLAGTLTLPEGVGPFPAVVLVSGSGPQDRDETIMNHKPFHVIADYLSRNGIAVLRYDDRGVGKSGGIHHLATSLDFAQDAESALNYLNYRMEINHQKTGLAGHSEGGLIASIVGSRMKELDFIITLSGPGLTGEQIIYLQSALISRAGGSSDEEIQKELALTKRVFELVKNSKDSSEVSQKLNMLVEDYLSGLTDEEKKKPENSKQTLQAQWKRVNNDWFKFFLMYDPVPDFEKITIPVLALNGEKDLQVPPKENLAAIGNALKKAGNKNYKTVELKNLNHLFQNAATGSPSEYAVIEETFSPDALKMMSDWIHNEVK